MTQSPRSHSAPLARCAEVDLALTAEQIQLADSARTAFSSGGASPLIEGSLLDLVVVSRELGRVAGDLSFHNLVLARALGWRGSAPVAVGLESRDGIAEFVSGAARSTTFLVQVAPTEVVVLQRADVALIPQPTLADAHCCQVTFSPTSAHPRLNVDVAGAVARAAVVIAADAVGAAEAAMDAAVAHVNTRHQWGAPLGVLQVVRHRCADMLLDVTIARDAVFDAAGVADRDGTEREVRLAAAFAMSTAVERCRRVTAAAHQLAGGQGIDAAAPFHRWYRRVKHAESALGDARSHREHIAAALFDHDV